MSIFKMSFIYRYICIIFSVFIFQCTPTAKPPHASKGVLDLTSWKFEQTNNHLIKTNIPLNGEWEFYWKQLLLPKDFTNSEKELKKSYTFVPGVWNHHPENIETSIWKGDGYATYRLKIDISNAENLSLKIKAIGTAYRLYCNGILLGGSGEVGIDESSSKPSFQTHILDLPNSTSGLEIILHVSNFHHKKGGIFYPILLASRKDNWSLREGNLLLDIFLASSIFIMGVYHLGLFFSRRKNFSNLYFSLSCLSLALRSVLTGESYFYTLFPNFPFDLGLKLSYLNIFSTPILFILFLTNLFPVPLHSFPFRFLLYSSLFLIGIVIVFPAKIYTLSLPIMDILSTLSGIYAVYVLYLAVKNNSVGARIFSLGYLLFLLINLNDILHANQIIFTGFYLPIGFFLFTISQSVVLAIRYAHAFQISENLNVILEQKVKERTNELEGTLSIIRNDLNMAKKIQKNLLTINKKLLNELNIVPLYLPMSEVGGDFYDVCKVNDTTYRVFQADATGHGVQAAMMTMAIKGLYDDIKYYDLEISYIMEILNNEFINKYSSLNSFMTAFLVDIDVKKKELKYVSAGHPAAVLLTQNGNTLLEKTGKMIGILKKTKYEFKLYPFLEGNRLFVFTDGLFEEFNELKEEFGEERLHSVILNNKDLPLEPIYQQILLELDSFLKSKQKQDDITLIGLEYKAIVA